MGLAHWFAEIHQYDSLPAARAGFFIRVYTSFSADLAKIYDFFLKFLLHKKKIACYTLPVMIRKRAQACHAKSERGKSQMLSKVRVAKA